MTESNASKNMTPNLINLTVDGIPVEVEAGSSVRAACEKIGIEIPVFCYHPKLSIAGNCRMCLVEMEKSPKPIASCAMPAAEGMVIKTTTDMVKKAREGVLELLLINHPLDCPICDQGGECDLQDITMSYGRGESRFDLNKRAVTDKYMGPLIKTIMTRCIHCTRCVRFMDEVAGTHELAGFHRGEHMEITSLLEGAITSELSGNLVDICPVGALTNKPYAFQGRSWELTKTNTIDVMDALGAHIRIDSRGSEIMRILPRSCDALNEEWITDRTRFAYDGLKSQRLDKAYVRTIATQHKLKASSIEEAISHAARLLTSVKPSEIAVLSGDLADVDGLYALKKCMESLGVEHFESRTQGSTSYPTSREDYLFNTTLEGIQKSDACLLIGTNPRREATLVNTRLRKRFLGDNLPIALVGEGVDLTYPYAHMGAHASDLEFLRDEHHSFTKILKNAHFPLVIMGEGALAHLDGEKILALVKDFSIKNGVIRSDWNGFNILSSQAGTVGALDLGYLPKDPSHTMETLYRDVEAEKIKVLYLYGVDNVDFERLKKAHIMYQGHHGGNGAHHADVILPGAAYTEKTTLYVNMEGRVQQTTQVVPPPGEAGIDWEIISTLAQKLNKPLPFETREALLTCLKNDYPVFKNFDPSEKLSTLSTLSMQSYVPEFDKRVASAKLSNRSFQPVLRDPYLTNVVTRHSKILSECSRLAHEKTLEVESVTRSLSTDPENKNLGYMKNQRNAQENEIREKGPAS